MALEYSELLVNITAYVQNYMSNYDSSHDWSHIHRVLALSYQIATTSPPPPGTPSYNTQYITLAALLHDIGDRKYRREDEDPTTIVHNLLLHYGASPQTAQAVQKIVTHVSYSTEIKDPEIVKEVIKEHPELAVVQDADRIDALGAVGIGRAFTFAAAREMKGGNGMQESVAHFEDKLEKLEGMMKTEAGRKIARERTERLAVFKGWWKEEAVVNEGLGVDFMSWVEKLSWRRT